MLYAQRTYNFRRRIAEFLLPELAKERERDQLALDAAKHYLAVWKGEKKPDSWPLEQIIERRMIAYMYSSPEYIAMRKQVEHLTLAKNRLEKALRQLSTRIDYGPKGKR